MEYFDYKAAAAEAGLTPSQLKRLERLVSADYPSDLMLRELHLLRACKALRSGVITLDQLLQNDLPDPGANSEPHRA